MTTGKWWSAAERPRSPRPERDVRTPVLYLIVGPNGAGKTTLFERVIGPATGLEFVNADRFAVTYNNEGTETEAAATFYNAGNAVNVQSALVKLLFFWSLLFATWSSTTALISVL